MVFLKNSLSKEIIQVFSLLHCVLNYKKEKLTDPLQQLPELLNDLVLVNFFDLDCTWHFITLFDEATEHLFLLFSEYNIGENKKKWKFLPRNYIKIVPLYSSEEIKVAPVKMRQVMFLNRWNISL